MIKKLAFFSYLALSSVSQAYASGDASTGHGTTHEEQAGGLPQLDPSSFESQSFWLIVIFVGLYFIFAKKSLPDISKTIEDRAERINNDLDSAEQIKNEVALVQEEYEARLKEAREQSSGLFKNIEEEIKARSDEETKKFQEYSVKKIAELEETITKARDEAMNEMTEIAAEVANQAAEKIIGVSADAKSARDAVKSIRKAA